MSRCTEGFLNIRNRNRKVQPNQVDSTIVADACAKLQRRNRPENGKKQGEIQFFHLMNFAFGCRSLYWTKIFVRGSTSRSFILKQKRTSREYLRDRQGFAILSDERF